MSDRAFWQWVSVALVVTAFAEVGMPDVYVPALVTQFWLGLFIAVVAAFWPPPSGPDGLTGPDTKAGDR